MKLKQLRASSAHRWWACHGSARAELIAPLASDDASHVSLEGAAAHRLFELCLAKREDAEVYLGESILLPRERERFNVDEDMVEHIQAGVDLVRAKRGKGQLWLESPIRISTKALPVNGTLDAAWHGQYKNEVTGKLEWQLHVMDLKYGRLLVEAHDNKQLMIYGQGKLLELTKAGKRVDAIHLWIYQPRSQHDDGPFRHIMLTPFELAEFAVELSQVVDDVVKPRAPMTAGPWCLYCGAHAVCATAEQANLRLARSKFRADDTGRIGELKFQLPRLKHFIQAVEELAKNMGLNGNPPVGWMMAPGRQNRRFRGNDKEQLKETAPALVREFKLKLDAIAPRKLLSVSKIEKLIPKGKRDRLKAHYFKVRGADRLVPENANRASTDAEAYFEADDGQEE